MKRLEGKVAVVTGGGEGVGRSIAQLFAEEGARVGILELNPELAEAAAAEIRSTTGVDAAHAVANIASEDQVRAGVAALAEKLGSPTVLVNNAAAFVFKGLDATPEDWQTVLSVNVMGPALVAKHVVPHMRQAGSGAIVNIASISGSVAQREFLTYNASKGAVLTMTKCMALDLAEDGVRVNSVSPGPVWSAGVQRVAAARGWDRELTAQQPGLGRETMLKRLADPHEVATAALYLASGEASYVTGTNLMVDGGWSAL